MTKAQARRASQSACSSSDEADLLKSPLCAQDVYGEIAAEVNKMVAADAEKGLHEALALQAGLFYQAFDKHF